MIDARQALKNKKLADQQPFRVKSKATYDRQCLKEKSNRDNNNENDDTGNGRMEESLGARALEYDTSR
jgi:hypothetical protein